MKTRIKPVKNNPCLITVWRTIHLGKNPRKGGKPPNDINLVNIINWLALLNSKPVA